MFRPHQLLILILLLLPASLKAQETAATCTTSSLYGQVLSADPQKPLRAVEILAKRISDKGILDQRESQGEWYCIKVPTFSKVFLFFLSDGYDPQSSGNIDTSSIRKRHSWPVPAIRLEPITLGRNELQDTQDKQEKRQSIRVKLNKHKEAVNSTGPNDLFIWNMELYKSLYRENPSVTAEINQFISELKADAQFNFLKTDEYKQKSELFRFIIARDKGLRIESDVKPSELIALINTQPTFSGIRTNAISTLSLLKDLIPTEKERAFTALIKALEEDESVAVRVKAAEVLGAIGDQPHVLVVLRKAAKEDESSEVQSVANSAAELVASRPMGEQTRIARTETATRVTTTTMTLVGHITDGSYTVIQYPVDKEVIVDLMPGTLIPGAKGFARVIRKDDATNINLDLSNITGGATNFNVYAIDPSGKFTLLGPVTVANGVATQTFTTTLDKFMLVLTPPSAFTPLAADTPILFRSGVPQGFAVIPVRSRREHDLAGDAERVATRPPDVTPAYTAPLLGIPNWRQGTDTEMKIKFAGEMTGTRANVSIEPRKDGATTIRMRFHELKEAPGGKRYVLWAVSADNKFHRLGQVVNTGQRNEAEIRTETGLPDFGLFITTEDIHDAPPTGTIVGTVIRDR